MQMRFSQAPAPARCIFYVNIITVVPDEDLSDVNMTTCNEICHKRILGRMAKAATEQQIEKVIR